MPMSAGFVLRRILKGALKGREPPVFPGGDVVCETDKASVISVSAVASSGSVHKRGMKEAGSRGFVFVRSRLFGGASVQREVCLSLYV